ncbi:hypothetical protein LguiB_033735 [Lonicera macranthoides]
MVKAIGFRETLNWLKSIHISKVIMEGDSVELINALNSDVVDHSSLRLIIDDY